MAPDIASSIDTLLEEQDWVARLAYSLVEDSARADDVIQETWLAALRSPPRPGSGRAWLATVLRNAIRASHRSEARRASREIAAAQTRATGRDEPDVIERLETQAAVVRAVTELAEPYRRTIVGRYLEDHSIDALASRDGVPRETVRTRLRRGRDLLRRSLESRGVDRSTLFVLAPLSPAKVSVSALSAECTLSTVAPPLFTSGGVLMSMKTTAVATAVAIGFASYSWVLGSRLDEEHQARVAAEQSRSAAVRKAERMADELAATRRSLDEATGDDAFPPRSESAGSSQGLSVASSSSDPVRVDRASLRPVFRSLDEADRIAADALAREDLEALWLLAADLLRIGEPGYEKLIELAAKVEAPKDGELWRSEEMISGPFLATLTANLGPVLEFGLYLDRQRDRAMPELIEDVQKQLLHETGVALLGYYDNADAELLDRYVAMYRRQLAETPITEHRYGEDIVRALGQIRTDDAFRFLEELLHRTEGRLQTIVIRAIAWQAHEESLGLLETLRARRPSDADNRVLDAALRYLRP